MKTNILLITSVILILMAGCEKSENVGQDTRYLNSTWVFTKIISNEDGQTTMFPEEINSFYITFKEDGQVELSGFCNFSYATYEISGSDSIYITELGPSTLRGCFPFIIIDWETYFAVNFPNATTYSISQDQLIINCDSEYDLVFEYYDGYDPGYGGVLFCTNGPILNCIFEIEITVDGEIMDTLTAASAYDDFLCTCFENWNCGTDFELASGMHSYSAVELNCIADNKVNAWEGDFSVTEDSCSVVFLDVTMPPD